jgi:hypothetical protein
MRALAIVPTIALALWATHAAAGEPTPPAKQLQPGPVRVLVANRTQLATGLHALPAGAGWRLDVTSDAQSADIIDLTPGTPARTFTLSVLSRALRFDSMRFVGGHVYRVALRSRGRVSASLVYLYPDPAMAKLPKSGTQRVRFEGDDAPAAADSDGIRPVNKGSL